MPKYIHIVLAPNTKIKLSFEESLKSLVAIGIFRNKYGHGQYFLDFKDMDICFWQARQVNTFLKITIGII